MPAIRVPAPTVRLLVLLVDAIAVVGLLAVRGGSGADVAGDLWPVGLATGVLCVASRRTRPIVLATLVAIAVVTNWWGGRPLGVAIGLAVAATSGAWLVWRLIHGTREGRGSLVSDKDLSRFLIACLAGAALAGTVAAATSAVTGWRSPALAGLATGVAHFAAQLIVVPFFLRVQIRPSLAPTGETVALWLVTGVMTPLAFWSDQLPVFLLFPALVWGALRVNPRHALWQMAAVSCVAVTMTLLGFGRFAESSGELGLGGYEPEFFAELFVIACVLAVVPLLLNIGQQVDSARDAVAADDNLQQIMESALSVAIIGTDAQGQVNFFSPGAQRLLGYAPDEVLGRSVAIFYERAEISRQAEALGVEDSFAAVVQGFVASPRLGSGRDFTYLCKDGQQRTHATSVVKRVDGRGQTSGFVITSEDVTDRVKAQASLVEALDVERRAVDRLRQIDQIKDDLISTVSHELRTPITSIVGYVELFEDGVYGAVNDQQLGALGRVGSNSERLLTLIDKLLTLSRIQDESHEVVDETVDLREILRSGYAVVATESRIRDLDVRLDLPATVVPFLGDGEMLERVVVNLVDNAIKFTPAGGQVSVRLTATDDEALIEVSDTGIGIPADEQDQLFTRFFRSSLAREREIPGTGLGLSITRAVVEMHDGTLEVRSRPGLGTTFGVRLPRRRIGRPALAVAPGSGARRVTSDHRVHGVPLAGPRQPGRRPMAVTKQGAAMVTYEQFFPATPRRQRPPRRAS